MHPDDTDAPKVDRSEYQVDTGGTIRLRGNSKYTQKEGWHPADITVEYTGPSNVGNGVFEVNTLRVYQELAHACRAMNSAEGRVRDVD